MEGGVVFEEKRGAERVSSAWRRSKGLWYVIWGAMALLAFASAMVAANGSASAVLFASKFGIVAGVLLAALASVLLSQGPFYLAQKEATLAATLLALFIFAQLGHWLLSVPPASLTTDFVAYYESGRAVAENRPASLYSAPIHPDGRASERPLLYPPLFAVLMTPFASLSYGRAFLVWNCLTALLILASVYMGMKLGGKVPGSQLVLILIVGVFSYYPMIYALRLGQVAGLILFLWTACVWALARNQVWTSAFCFALATMIKLTPAIALPVLVFHRKWRWLVAYGCWLVFLLGFSIWRVGWTAQMEFVSKVMPSLSCGVAASQNASLFCYVQELLLGRVSSVDGTPLTVVPWACVVSKIVALVVYGAIMFRFYFYRREAGLTRQLILMTLLSLVVSPISWWHHYTIALLPFVYFWSVMREPGKDLLLLATVLIVGTNIVGFALQLASNHVIQLVLAGVVPCLTLALVWRGVSDDELSKGNPELA